ncbi:hypothetical protein NDU88_004129 [Pleurodeles waltl]|uniref:Uncharacterized protein n=1 Tax=Pleurodeles waltl TaxID=8319 RepID=A0AAV7M8C1_PLEWA|nr:hypothetical protein NDU88_004129 [Pleurodeles waltl]
MGPSCRPIQRSPGQCWRVNGSPPSPAPPQRQAVPSRPRPRRYVRDNGAPRHPKNTCQLSPEPPGHLQLALPWAPGQRHRCARRYVPGPVRSSELRVRSGRHLGSAPTQTVYFTSFSINIVYVLDLC